MIGLGPQSLHRFVIDKPGTLGMRMRKGLHSTTGTELCVVVSVDANSLSEIYGIQENDILCKPYTNGRDTLGVFDWFKDQAKGSRPLVFDVLRAVPTSVAECSTKVSKWSGTNENPFKFSFPETTEPAAQNESVVDASAKTAEKGDNGNVAKPSEKSNSSGKEAPIILLDDEPEDWECDFCGKEFDTYDNAVQHEKTCHTRQHNTASHHDDNNSEEEKKKDSD